MVPAVGLIAYIWLGDQWMHLLTASEFIAEGTVMNGGPLGACL